MKTTTLLARLAIGTCGCVAGFYAAYSAFKNGQNYAPGIDGTVVGAAFAAVVVGTWFILPATKNMSFGERWSARAGWLLLTAFVLTNATGFTATHRTNTVGEKQNTIAAYNTARQGLEQATERLTAMKGNRRWESTKGCTDATVEQSVTFCNQFSETQAKADKLQAIVLAGQPATSDAQADTIGWVIRADTATVSKALPIFMAVVLDIAATLFMYLALASKEVRLNSDRPANPVATPKAAEVITDASKKSKPAKAKKKTTRAKRWTPAQTQKLLQQALQRPDGRTLRPRNSNIKVGKPANANEPVNA